MGPAAEGATGRVTGDELEEVTGQAVQDMEAQGFSFCSVTQGSGQGGGREADREVSAGVQPGGDPGAAWTEVTAMEEFHLGI